MGDDSTDAALTRLLERAGIAHELVAMEGGTYNDVFRGYGSDGGSVIIKVGPHADSSSLTYETDLLAVEADYFRTAAARGLPVPEVLAYDDGALIGRAFLVMSALGGHSYTRLDLADRRGSKSDEDLCRQVGHTVAQAHALRPAAWPPGFGYPYREQLWRPTWPEAFSAMMAAVIDDAARYQVDLPVPARTITECIVRSQPALAGVAHPAMVHFDLWDGNLLVEAVDPSSDRQPGDYGAGGRVRLTGIVDAERSMSADPLFEVPSLRHNRTLPFHSAYFQAYNAAGPKPTPLKEPNVTVRIANYTLYLSLVMLVEATPRHYTAERAAERAESCAQQIRQQIEILTQDCAS